MKRLLHKCNSPGCLGKIATPNPREVWRDRSPSNFNPQGWLCHPEDSDFCVRSAAKRRRLEQIITTLQFLRPEISRRKFQQKL